MFFKDSRDKNDNKEDGYIVRHKKDHRLTRGRIQGGGKGGNASPLIPFCPPPQISAPPGSCPGGGKEFLGPSPISQGNLTVLLSNAIIKPKNLNLNNGYLNIKCHFEVNIDYSLY